MNYRVSFGMPHAKQKLTTRTKSKLRRKLEHWTYDKNLKELGLLSLEKK